MISLSVFHVFMQCFLDTWWSTTKCFLIFLWNYMMLIKTRSSFWHSQLETACRPLRSSHGICDLCFDLSCNQLGLVSGATIAVVFKSVGSQHMCDGWKTRSTSKPRGTVVHRRQLCAQKPEISFGLSCLLQELLTQIDDELLKTLSLPPDVKDLVSSRVKLGKTFLYIWCVLLVIFTQKGDAFPLVGPRKRIRPSDSVLAHAASFEDHGLDARVSEAVIIDAILTALPCLDSLAGNFATGKQCSINDEEGSDIWVGVGHVGCAAIYTAIPPDPCQKHLLSGNPIRFYSGKIHQSTLVLGHRKDLRAPPARVSEPSSSARHLGFKWLKLWLSHDCLLLITPNRSPPAAPSAAAADSAPAAPHAQQLGICFVVCEEFGWMYDLGFSKRHVSQSRSAVCTLESCHAQGGAAAEPEMSKQLQTWSNGNTFFLRLWFGHRNHQIYRVY